MLASRRLNPAQCLTPTPQTSAPQPNANASTASARQAGHQAAGGSCAKAAAGATLGPKVCCVPDAGNG